jgi:hypothetical protein
MHRNEECLRDNRKTKRSFVPRQTPAYFSSASYFARVAADSAAFGGRYTQPPRAMIAAQSRIMTTAPNSP